MMVNEEGSLTFEILVVETSSNELTSTVEFAVLTLTPSISNPNHVGTRQPGTDAITALRPDDTLQGAPKHNNPWHSRLSGK